MAPAEPVPAVSGADAAAPAAALERARVWRALARLFRHPDAETLDALRRRFLPELRLALERLGADGLADSAERLIRRIGETGDDALAREHRDLFETGGDPRCSPYETSHTAGTPQHAYTRTFELADIAAFYRAFGVGTIPAGERVDHVSAELEFLQLLAAKEAVARAAGEKDHVTLCEDATRSFLGDHLSRWMPRFASRMAMADDAGVYAAAATLLEGFVALQTATSVLRPNGYAKSAK